MTDCESVRNTTFLNILKDWLQDWGQKKNANTLQREIEKLMEIEIV